MYIWNLKKINDSEIIKDVISDYLNCIKKFK